MVNNNWCILQYEFMNCSYFGRVKTLSRLSVDFGNIVKKGSELEGLNGFRGIIFVQITKRALRNRNEFRGKVGDYRVSESFKRLMRFR